MARQRSGFHSGFTNESNYVITISVLQDFHSFSQGFDLPQRMDLRKKAACFFFMERKKAPDAPCAGQRDSPDDSPHRRVDFSANGCGIAPSPIAHGAPPDMPRTAVYGQRRPEAKVTRIVSAPEQICSSRRFQAEAHSPVPLCASPKKRVSAQEAALSGRSLYTANAARRAVQKPG